MQLVMKAVPNGISSVEKGILSTSIADPQHPGQTIDCTNLARAMIKAGLLDWQGNCQNLKYYITISGEDVIVDFSDVLASQPDGFDEAAAMEILSSAQVSLNVTLGEALRLQRTLRVLHRTGEINFILNNITEAVHNIAREVDELRCRVGDLDQKNVLDQLPCLLHARVAPRLPMWLRWGLRLHNQLRRRKAGCRHAPKQ